jgi:hypothetical protein
MKFNLGDVVKIKEGALFLAGAMGEVIGIFEGTDEYRVGFFMLTDDGDELMYDDFIYYGNELELKK